jgi:hypothetical protein
MSRGPRSTGNLIARMIRSWPAPSIWAASSSEGLTSRSAQYRISMV